MNTMQCEGWWEQRGLGRQPMENLQLTFDQGRLWGQGLDVIGPFTLQGQLSGEKAVLSKQYHGAHHVDYPGFFDGEGTLQGHWKIDTVGGRWMIRVVKPCRQESTFPQSDLPIQDWPS